MIKDDDFIKNPEVPGPTKEEIRCLVMCKSQVSGDDTVLEIGCGTGGLTVEFAKRAVKVYSLDKNPAALEVTRKNLIKHGVEHNTRLVKGDALKILEDMPDFEVLMVGGSSGELPLIIKKGYKKLKTDGRIVVTSILLETKVEAVETMLGLGMVPDVVEVSVSKGRITERGTMMICRNPVTIISARK
jgi:cobalt-precorrin-6B (C15)-methyltransferase